MTRASYPTLLALDRYAKLLGIAPLHFAGAHTSSLNPIVFPTGGCNSMWRQYDWQHLDQVSREQLAEVIAEAETDIMNIVGYPVAPMWFALEDHHYPHPFDVELKMFGLGADWRIKTIPTNYGKVIAAGQRLVTLRASPTASGLAPTLVYSDPDGDGYFELATITVPCAETDPKKLHLYFAGQNADPCYEVRPLKSISIVGGVATILVDAWLLIDQTWYEAFPTSDDENIGLVDVSDITNYVSDLELYSEDVAPTLPSAVFKWDHGYGCTACGGSGCDLCAEYSQNGCARIREPQAGLLAPYPATYDGTTQLWTAADWGVAREPDHVQLYYKAGDLSPAYLSGRSLEPLSDYWARTIAYLATARLDRPFCDCGNLQAIGNDLQEDLSLSDSGKTYFNSPGMIDNPLGTRRGEVIAWRRISKVLKDRRIGVAVI